MLDDVVTEHEIPGRRAIVPEDISFLFYGIVLNQQRFGSVDLDEVSSVARIIGGQISQQVVRDANAPRLLTLVLVIMAQDVKAGAGMTHEVIGYLDILNGAPGSPAILVPRSEDKGSSQNLAFDQVPVDFHSPGVLQLEGAFDHRTTGPLFRFA